MNGRPSLSLQKHIVDAESVNDDNWTMSYIDVFVLMTSIFVVLFMLSNQQFLPVEKEETPNNLVEREDIAMHPEVELIQDINPYQAWIENIKAIIREQGLSGYISLEENAAYSSLEIRSHVLFNSGEASLSRAGEALLLKIVPVLSLSEGLIFIEGHTDNQAITSNMYSSNWDLAAARATQVLSFFVLEGIATERLRAVSYGDTKPIKDNNTEANRQQNRRVSLLIQKLSY